MEEDLEDEFGDGKEKEDEDGIYSEEGREELIEEEDEITDLDEGFMKGYDEGEKAAVCANCGHALGDKFVEEEFNGEVYRFCSDECASEFEERKVRH